MVGGDKQSLGRSSVKYAQAIQRLCIIERSKWEQDEYHGSLILNVFTVSGKTAVWAKGGGVRRGLKESNVKLNISFGFSSALIKCTVRTAIT